MPDQCQAARGSRVKDERPLQAPFGRNGLGVIRTDSSPFGHLNRMNSSPTPLSAHRTFHLKLDELVHLNGVFHRQLLDERLDEAADDQVDASASESPRLLR